MWIQCAFVIISQKWKIHTHTHNKVWSKAQAIIECTSICIHTYLCMYIYIYMYCVCVIILHNHGWDQDICSAQSTFCPYRIPIQWKRVCLHVCVCVSVYSYIQLNGVNMWYFFYANWWMRCSMKFVRVQIHTLHMHTFYVFVFSAYEEWNYQWNVHFNKIAITAAPLPPPTINEWQ